jgi:flagellum-specific peptidoglycan hydrolase FlgJ
MNARQVKNQYRSNPVKIIERAISRWNKSWFKWALSLMAAMAIIRKDIAFSISLDPPPPISTTSALPRAMAQVASPTKPEPPLNVSLLSLGENKRPGLPTESTPEEATIAEKRKKQEAYIHLYAQLAQLEMQQYGIPASITLAQGLLETNAGESPLATDANNHFGIKCFSKVCRKGHCRNFEDDSHKDFFRIYTTPGESYRAHSILLQSPRYQPLYQLSVKNYTAWARGLKKAGYATDPHYAEKLIRLIEEFQLYRYDG